MVGDQLKSIVLAAYILHGYDYPSVYNIHGFPDEDRRFLKLIFSNKPVKIPEEFNSIYLDILKQIINVADDDSLNKYLAYAHYFQKPVWKDIIDIMIDNRMFASRSACVIFYTIRRNKV